MRHPTLFGTAPSRALKERVQKQVPTPGNRKSGCRSRDDNYSKGARAMRPEHGPAVEVTHMGARPFWAAGGAPNVVIADCSECGGRKPAPLGTKGAAPRRNYWRVQGDPYRF